MGIHLPKVEWPDWQDRKQACDRCLSCGICILSNEWEPHPSNEEIAMAEQATAKERGLPSWG